MSQEPRLIQSLFGAIAARYDLANHLLSGGLDFLWRRRAGELVRGWNPNRILDLATGSGDLALTLKQHCPQALVVGADFCYPMLAQAQTKRVPNLINGDGMQLPFGDDCFDLLTIAFGLRNMASWGGALREMNRVIKPGGHLLVLDFSVPSGALRTPYRFYLHHILPRIAGALTGQQGAYEYLGASIEAFPNGNAMTALIEECGFDQATCEWLTGGIVSIYTATKR